MTGWRNGGRIVPFGRVLTGWLPDRYGGAWLSAAALVAVVPIVSLDASVYRPALARRATEDVRCRSPTDGGERG